MPSGCRSTRKSPHGYEWQPTSIRTLAGLLYFGSVALVVLLIARRGRVVPWPTLLWLAVFAVVALYAERGIAWWPLAAVPAVASLLRGTADRARVEAPLMRRLNGAVAALLALGMVIFLPVWQPVDPLTGAPEGLLTDAPPGLTQAVRDVAAPGAHVFQPQPWGSWFEYAVPDVLVAIDSRIELFPPEVWDQYEQVVAGVEGWDAQLQVGRRVRRRRRGPVGLPRWTRGRRVAGRHRGSGRGGSAGAGRLRVVTAIDRTWLAKRGHAYAGVSTGSDCRPGSSRSTCYGSSSRRSLPSMPAITERGVGMVDRRGPVAGP